MMTYTVTINTRYDVTDNIISSAFLKQDLAAQYQTVYLVVSKA